MQDVVKGQGLLSINFFDTNRLLSNIQTFILENDLMQPKHFYCCIRSFSVAFSPKALAFASRICLHEFLVLC